MRQVNHMKKTKQAKRILGRKNSSKCLKSCNYLVLLVELEDFLYFKRVKYKLGCSKE
jgi:hypothetical protein